MEGEGGFVQWTKVMVTDGGGRRGGTEVGMAVEDRCCASVYMPFNAPGFLVFVCLFGCCYYSHLTGEEADVLRSYVISRG